MFSSYPGRFYPVLILCFTFLSTCRTVYSLHRPVAHDGLQMRCGLPGGLNLGRIGSEPLHLDLRNHDWRGESTASVDHEIFKRLRLRGGSEAAFASASMMAANPEMAKQFFGSNLISQSRKIGSNYRPNQYGVLSAVA